MGGGDAHLGAALFAIDRTDAMSQATLESPAG